MMETSIAHTLHNSHWVLHLWTEDVWSEYCGKVLDTHLVLIRMGLDLIKEPKKKKTKKNVYYTL